MRIPIRKRTNKKIPFWFVAVKPNCVGLLFVLLFAIDATAQEPISENLIHYDLDGDRFRLSDVVPIAGEFPPIPDEQGAVILIFGAYWCQPCHQIVQTLQRHTDEISASETHVVYVHVDDVDRSAGLTPEELRARVAEMAAEPAYSEIRVLLGGDMLEVSQWVGDASTGSLPGVVLIHADGSIVYRTSGHESFEEALVSFLDAVVGSTD